MKKRCSSQKDSPYQCSPARVTATRNCDAQSQCVFLAAAMNKCPARGLVLGLKVNCKLAPSKKNRANIETSYLFLHLSQNMMSRFRWQNLAFGGVCVGWPACGPNSVHFQCTTAMCTELTRPKFSQYVVTLLKTISHVSRSSQIFGSRSTWDIVNCFCFMDQKLRSHNNVKERI